MLNNPTVENDDFVCSQCKDGYLPVFDATKTNGKAHIFD